MLKRKRAKNNVDTKRSSNEQISRVYTSTPNFTSGRDFFTAVTACSERSGLPSPPISVPVKLEQSGTIADFQFRVTEHNVYYYYLEFKFPEESQVERALLRKLLGGTAKDRTGKLQEPGIPIPIKLTVTKINQGMEEKIYGKEIDPPRSGSGTDFFTKQIGHCDLTPGTYRARVEILRSAPEFSSISVNFLARMHSSFSLFDPQTLDKSKSCPQ